MLTKKLNKAEKNIQSLGKSLSDKKAALATLDNEGEILRKKINELNIALKNAKNKQTLTGSEHKKDVQKTNAAYNDALAKLKKSEAQITQLEKELTELKALANTQTAKLKAQLALLQKKQAETSTETESLQAQVIGFEKVVEERNANLAEVGSDLQDCKVNTKVLLAKITEQENAQQGMEEKMHLMVQDLSEEAARKDTASVQEEQPTQAK